MSASTNAPTNRPPSVDRLARELRTSSDLPHPLLVEVARRAIADGAPELAAERAHELARTLLTPVVNATGVLLHTNLGRAPLGHHQHPAAQNVEFDLASGERGSRHRGIGHLFATLCGAEAAMVVNNNAAAVMLALAAVADGRGVAVSRGESVEIGGSFRVPDVMRQSGAQLIDVGTTNRTRRSDYEAAIAAHDVAAVLKVHPSNYRIEGFTEEVTVADLAGLGVPVIADIGSGLIDASTPWLPGAPPSWLHGEPAAAQSIAAGADLVTFSGDKLFGGPQAGIIMGRTELVQRCARHPLARALRCGGLVLAALQQVALAYLHRRVVDEVPFWSMAAASTDDLRSRAERICAEAGLGSVVATEALPGAGSAPGVSIPSIGIEVDGDHLDPLRRHRPPIIARTRGENTTVDLRSVAPTDDTILIEALGALR